MKVPSVSLFSRENLAGQTMVEFALVASTFFLLLFGIIQMASAAYNYNAVCSAAREAVRYAIVHSASSSANIVQIQQIAMNVAPSLNLQPSNIQVTFPSDANLTLQQDAQVQVSYQYQLKIPFLSPLTLTLSSTSRMLLSQPQSTP
jgi:Flp pilus assembly protein TadG